MKIKYDFVKDFDYKETVDLKEIGINVKTGFDNIGFYDGSETLEKIKRYYGNSWTDYIRIEPEFTENEKLGSPYLSVMASKMLGYPQPEDWDGDDDNEPEYPFDLYPYYQNIFEIDKVSEYYGVIKGKQIGNLSLLGEPKWGKFSIGSIYWCEDILFTTPNVYEKIFKPLGILCRDVLGYGNQKVLKTIVQLLPQGISDSSLILSDEELEEKTYISEWNLTRYFINRKSFFPSFKSDPGNFDFFVSQEYFGTGHANYKELFISQKLYSLLKQNNIKGITSFPQKINT